ncbi:pilus assembly protein [Sphingobium amiense]|uniref:Pilus assembly protein n=1 Tax=Sphingobium amiense TaxID=135719 RepID=A0A494W5Z6_9SPHN|nr:TadE/TadG family type IV pilus assembly protein [Sphingobium amiense]BBD97977.1 pilus assembly protein [Sphingobium amiense]
MRRPILIDALRRHLAGMAAVEFALTAPVLILMFLGTFQVTDAVGAKRKLGIATRAIADLTTQYTSISSSEADSILQSSNQIMAPYNAAPGTFVVSQIYVSPAGAATVQWSRARNGTARTTGASVTLPTGVAQNDSYVILAESSYPYTPTVGLAIVPTITMNEQIYMYPRLSDSVNLQ